jgi:dTDP-4-dehydrorhamnose reductase
LDDVQRIVCVRVFLIGASGQLGTDLRPLLPADTVALDVPDIDVCDRDGLAQIMRSAAPGVVINCAAQTHVDGCEDAPEAAFAVNAIGAGHVAEVAAELGARVVYVSTDFVFGAAGAREAAYVEGDVPGPLSVYGASKLAGEHLTLAADPAALVVRTSGLYGHAGARGKGGNFVETMLRLAAEGKTELRVVADQCLSPTATAHCARQIVALVDAGARGVVHVAAADHCTWHAFASAVFALAGVDVVVHPIGSDEYPQRARRPRMSALRSERLADYGLAPCPPWREMLAEYLAARPMAP